MKFQVPGTKGDGISRPIMTSTLSFDIDEKTAEVLKKQIPHFAEEIERVFGAKVKTIDLVIVVNTYSFDRDKDDG